MKRYLLIYLILSLSSSLHAQWTVVGTPNFTNGRADFIFSVIAPSGEPYIVCRENSLTSGRVMKFNGSGWVNVGPRFSAGDILTPTMAFDKYGTPYVAYSDRANCHKATVLKFDGTNWIAVGTLGFSPGGVSYTSIAFDSNNTPYVAFRDAGSCNYNSIPNGFRASVMKFDGTNWVYVGIPGFSSPGSGSAGALYTSLAIDKNNVLYVAYTDFSNGFKATVMTFDGTSWVNVGTGVISPGQTGSTSIVLDSHNAPYVAYVDVANSGKATVMKFDGNGWVSVGIPGFTPGNAEYTSLAIDKNDNLYLAFEDFANGHKASVMTFDGSNWTMLGAAGFSATKVFYTSLAVDNNTSTLYVAYEGYSDTAIYPGTVMKYNMANSINDTENDCSMSVYPNPATKTVTIKSKDSSGDFTLRVNNSSGKTVYSEDLKAISGPFTKQIDLSAFAKGVYFIDHSQGSKHSVQKIVLH